MSSLALYVIAEDYLEQLNKLHELDLDPQTLSDTLESMGGELEAKSLNVAMFIRNCETTIDAMKEAEKGMATRRKAAEKKVADLIEYLRGNMERCGIKKIDGPMLSLRIQSNPGAVIIDAPELVPPFFWRTPPPAPPPAAVIDKQAIKEAIAEGEEVPGARVEKGTRLVIKA